MCVHMYDMLQKKSTSFIQTILFYSDIRGVAIAGVEGEPLNLTELVAEAIAAAFAAWLLNKKEADGLRRLRISVGHDSRISAHKLQVPDFYAYTKRTHKVLCAFLSNIFFLVLYSNLSHY